MTDDLPRPIVGRLTDRIDGLEVVSGRHRAEIDNLAALEEQHAEHTQELADRLALLTTRVDEIADAPERRKPINWLDIDDPSIAAGVIARIVAWHDRYLPYLRAEQPTCWPWHPLIMVETIALADQYQHAYRGPAPQVSDLLSRWLPTYRTRCIEARRECHTGAHRIGPTAYAPVRALLPEYARWWATDRRGTPPGLTEIERD